MRSIGAVAGEPVGRGVGGEYAPRRRRERDEPGRERPLHGRIVPRRPLESTPMSRFGDAVNEQVGHEFAASQQYIAIAVHYDTQTLPNLAAHFYRQALEERNHAMMLVQYLLDADEDVVIPGIDAPRTEFDDIVAPVELALAQEREVTEQIKGLVRIARDDGELVGEQFLHWFLEEQREEVSSMSALLATVQRAGETNVLLVEEALARGTASNEAGPEASAPPAAGGAL